MNARQKAKYYKRKYEELAKQPLLPELKVTNYKVDKLRFMRLYPEALINGNEQLLVDTITRDLAYELVRKIDKYVTVRTNFEPHLNQYKVLGELEVVSREPDEDDFCSLAEPKEESVKELVREKIEIDEFFGEDGEEE